MLSKETLEMPSVKITRRCIGVRSGEVWPVEKSSVIVPCELGLEVSQYAGFQMKGLVEYAWLWIDQRSSLASDG